MELLQFTAFRAVSWPSLCLRPYSSKRRLFYSRANLGLRLNENSTQKPLRIMMKESLSNQNVSSNAEKELDSGASWGDNKHVEVLGIGSRKEAVLDFCLASPLKTPSLRFWNIVMQDAQKVQLQQKFSEKDFTPSVVEVPLSVQSFSKAIVLVVSAGYGSDHTAAVDILRTIKSRNGFSAIIVLKPFSFEGKRRHDEVKDLVETLKEHTSLFIDIDPDKLLTMDLVTLDEAIKTANGAVLLAINAISIIMCDTHKKLIDAPNNDVKELSVSEVIGIMETYKDAKVGFGAGYNIRTSILQSVYDCPFLGVGVKILKGVVICILASSGDLDNRDLDTYLRTFRDITGYTREILLSTIHEPSLEPNLLVTTVLVIGSTEQQNAQKNGIFSRLAEHLPFVFNLLWRPQGKLNDDQGDYMPESEFPSKVNNLPYSDELGTRIGLDDIAEEFDESTENIPAALSGSKECYNSSRSEEDERRLPEKDTKSPSLYDSVTEGSSLQREPLTRWNLGPGYQIAKQWASERAAVADSTPVLDNISIIGLPVGVRPSEDSFNTTRQQKDRKFMDSPKVQGANSSISSWNSLSDASLEAMRELYDTTSVILKGKNSDPPKKQGGLSVRAASMLQAERDSPKKWSPLVEMQYRGGVYRGRCQGGLPEGKGCLTLGDGSIYDGMWRYGKRSGVGTFYFSNGDVFQGSWRDDVMHGKGWFYFHSGDRWFANFWKGKAYGEGRFYSKSGEIIFGHFQEGWRDGRFLCINVDGTRYAEIWSQGFLVSREKLVSDSSPV